jgi:hypothetical protein
VVLRNAIEPAWLLARKKIGIEMFMYSRSYLKHQPYAGADFSKRFRPITGRKSLHIQRLCSSVQRAHGLDHSSDHNGTGFQRRRYACLPDVDRRTDLQADSMDWQPEITPLMVGYGVLKALSAAS